MSDRLDAQITFLIEADRLKSVTRANNLIDQSRAENSAEHSWHAALAALIWLDDHDPALVTRAIRKLILHDLVEIDAGDHPIHLDHDQAAVERAEAKAAERLFSLLPEDLGAEFQGLWTRFEAHSLPQAKAVDYALPVMMVSHAETPWQDHHQIAVENVQTGRARLVADVLPPLDQTLRHHLGLPHVPDPIWAARCDFLAEADRLKSVTRATTLCDASRMENSGEHSWHLALFAMVLADHAPDGVDIDRVIRMLLLHDLVEIDAGDVPIYSQNSAPKDAIEEAELAAARRLFGLLPASQGAGLLALWQEFEAAQSPDAIFAKALDRFQPPIQNIASNGAGWRAYNPSFDMVQARVGTPIQKGAPALWAWVAPRIKSVLNS